MNMAYKHLDSKLRIADLTIGAWIGVIAGVGCGIAWGLYISPFGPTLTLTLGIYVAALPIGAALSASLTEFDPWLTLRSAVAWRRIDGCFVPGPGDSAHGYLIKDEAQPSDDERRSGDVPDLDFSSLWGDAR